MAGRLQTSRLRVVGRPRNQRQQQLVLRPRPQLVLASTAQWQSDSAVHNEESKKKQELMMERFTAADTDGCALFTCLNPPHAHAQTRTTPALITMCCT